MSKQTLETSAHKIYVAEDQSFELYDQSGRFITNGIVISGELCEYTADLSSHDVTALESLLRKNGYTAK